MAKMVSEETTYTNGVIDLTARLAAMIMSPFKEHMVEKVEEVKTLQTPPSEAAIPAMEAIRKLFSEYETPEQATTRNETEVIEEIGDVERADRQVRTEKLRAIALDLHQLWCAGPTVLAKAAKIIADGSRDSKSNLFLHKLGRIESKTQAA